MAQSGFDMKKLTMGQKGIMAVGVLLMIVLFLPWRSIAGCQANTFGIPCSINGFSGFGVFIFILILGAIAWEVMLVMGTLNSVNAPKALIGAGLAGAIALFTLLKFLTSLSGGAFGLKPALGSWIGLILSLAMGYAAFLRFNESKGATPAPGAPPLAPPPPPPTA